MKKKKKKGLSFDHMVPQKHYCNIILILTFSPFLPFTNSKKILMGHTSDAQELFLTPS